MNAEIGILPDGRPYIQVTPSTSTEVSMVDYLRPFLPIVADYNDGCGTVRIIGERLPGSGKGP